MRCPAWIDQIRTPESGLGYIEMYDKK